MEVVFDHCPVAQDGGVELKRVWLAEQLNGLVDQMGAQIHPEPRSRHRLFAPARPHLGPEAVEMRLQVHDTAQLAAGQQVFQCQEVGVEPTVLIDRQDPVVARRQ
jgi:hypothetical protein